MIIVQLPIPTEHETVWRNYRGRQVLSDEGQDLQGKRWIIRESCYPTRRLSNTTWRCVTLHPRTNQRWHRQRRRAGPRSNSIKVGDALLGHRLRERQADRRLSAAYGNQ